MKKRFSVSLSTIILAVAAVALGGCTTMTPYGSCVGVIDSKNPKLEYRVEPLNVVMGVVFWETVVVPAVVVATQLQCPDGPAFTE